MRWQDVALLGLGGAVAYMLFFKKEGESSSLSLPQLPSLSSITSALPGGSGLPYYEGDLARAAYAAVGVAAQQTLKATSPISGSPGSNQFVQSVASVPQAWVSGAPAASGYQSIPLVNPFTGATQDPQTIVNRQAASYSSLSKGSVSVSSVVSKAVSASGTSNVCKYTPNYSATSNSVSTTSSAAESANRAWLSAATGIAPGAISSAMLSKLGSAKYK